MKTIFLSLALLGIGLAQGQNFPKACIGKISKDLIINGGF